MQHLEKVETACFIKVDIKKLTYPQKELSLLSQAHQSSFAYADKGSYIFFFLFLIFQFFLHVDEFVPRKNKNKLVNLNQNLMRIPIGFQV